MSSRLICLNVKNANHESLTKTLSMRLQLWFKDQVDKVFHEAKILQSKLQKQFILVSRLSWNCFKSSHKQKEEQNYIPNRRPFRGDRSPEDAINGNSKLEKFHENHPRTSQDTANYFVDTQAFSFVPYAGFILVNVNATSVCKWARKIHGNLSPSGLDANEWWPILAWVKGTHPKLRSRLSKIVIRFVKKKILLRIWHTGYSLLPLEKT